jgi:hypothetical protein
MAQGVKLKAVLFNMYVTAGGTGISIPFSKKLR